MTQGNMEKLAIPIQQNMSSLETRVMSDIVRRIHINGEITSTADWQMNRLYQMGLGKDEIKKAIVESLKLTDKQAEKLFKDAIGKEYTRNQQLYERQGKKWIPFDENEELQDLVTSISKQTGEELRNITQSLGFAIRGPNGRIIQSPLLEFYQGTLDDAMMNIASGTFDYGTVIRRAIQTMTNSGLRSIDYDSGGSNRVDVAARRAVMTGFNQLQAKVNEQVAQDLKTDYFEVSWHGGARPEHQAWQGGIYSHKQLVSVCGLGSAAGLCGANCYHSYNAFIPGVSVRTYTDEQLYQMNAQENQPKEYNGKEYTTYEALQKQRKLETLMRKQRQDIKLLQTGGASKDDLLAAKSRYRSTMTQYAEFSGKMNLPQQKERVYMDGLGRMVSEKEKVMSHKLPAKEKMTFMQKKEAIDNNEKHIERLHLQKKEAETKILFGSTLEEMESASKQAKVIKKQIEGLKVDNERLRKSLGVPTNAKERFFSQDLTALSFPQDIKENEYGAVSSWSRTDYVFINDYKRTGNKGVNSKSIQNAQTLEQMIDRNIVKEPFTVKRGTDYNALNHLFGNDSWKREGYNVDGKIISDKGYMATSPDLHGGFGGDVQMYIDVPKGAKGVYIGDLSAAPDEKEFLLQCGTHFNVEKIEIWYDKWKEPHYDVYMKVKVGD